VHGNVWEVLDAVDSRAYGRTQLSYAARDGHVGFVTELLSELDTNTSRRGDATQSAPPLSDRDNYSRVEEPLFDTDKADPDTKDKYGRTPLWWAPREGHEAVVKLLNARNS
jgi:ankyrin repeat protein